MKYLQRSLVLFFAFLISCAQQEEALPTFEVVFKSMGGTEVAAQYVTSGEMAEQPADPELEENIFQGWFLGETAYDFSNPVSENITLTAKWEGKTYLVAFDTQQDFLIDDVEVVSGALVEAPVLEEVDGYKFNAWMLDNQPYDFTQAVRQDIALIADWVAVYTVSFDTGHEGVEVDPQEIEEDELALLPAAPEVEGYTFTGWFLGDEAFDFNTPIQSNLTLTAAWEMNDGATTVIYDDISRASFEDLAMGEHILVKADIHFMMRGWAWGSEVYLVDDQGNSSKDFYGHSDFGMFSFPLRESDGFEFEKEYVFDLVKDIYMSSPQMGFGHNRADGYNGSRWIGECRYGIEYFDDVLRGNLKEVNADAGVVTIVIGDDQSIIIEDMSDAEITALEKKIGENVFVNVISTETGYASILKAGKPQVYNTFNNK
ncbi:InlB B-repeat-containing protein [Persicobacter diffluens]|uniref:InlB B-repeat-containing protein n=1 Tax=Persicobacter diffluens TaxID=981 RepID=A0AAN4W0S9_9BACT|nr:hypothetical protein PEDI_41510 [Persicobacter diffluens]